jgi:PAS domain S-box-containing protein
LAVKLVSKNVIQFGYDPEDFLSGELHYASIFHPDDYEHVNAGDEEFLATGKDRYEQVYRILGKRGDIYWVDERTVAERDTEGNVTHLQGIVIDVTARMNAEQKLQESEARVRRLLEQTFDAIVIHRDNRILFANDAAVKIIGAEGPEEVIGRAISHFLVSGSEEVIKERMRLLYSRPGTVVPLLEEKFRRVDGGVIDTEVMAASYIEDDKPTVQVIFRDITERNRILNELKESEENFRILVENVPDAIFITVSESLAFANPAAVRLFGASSAKQLLGRSVLDLIDPRFHDIMRNRLHQLMVELEPVETIDEVYLKLDGTPIDVEVAAVPFR